MVSCAVSWSLITDNRLVSLLPIGSNHPEIINTSATKVQILVWFRYGMFNSEKQLIKPLKLRSRIQNCSYSKHHTHQIKKYRLVPKGPYLKALKTNPQILNTHTNQKRNNWCAQEKTSKEFPHKRPCESKNLIVSPNRLNKTENLKQTG